MNSMFRLKIIIEFDIKNLIEKGILQQFSNKSFTSHMLSHLTNKPESRNVLTKALSDLYDEIDFDILEKLDLEEFIPPHWVRKRRHAFMKRNKPQMKNTVNKNKSPSQDRFDFDIQRTSSYTTAWEYVEKRKSRYSIGQKSKNLQGNRTKSTEKIRSTLPIPKIKQRFSSKERENHLSIFESSKSLLSSNNNITLYKYNSERVIEYLKNIIPSEIRLIWKVIYDTINDHKGNIGEVNENDLLEIVANFLYFNWLIYALFIQPHVYGLLKNNDVNSLLKVIFKIQLDIDNDT